MINYDREAIKEYLIGHGLDPNKILEDGISDRGYYTFPKLGEERSGHVRDFHSWPEGFNWGNFCQLLHPLPPLVPESREWVTRDEVRDIVLGVLAEIELHKLENR